MPVMTNLAPDASAPGGAASRRRKSIWRTVLPTLITLVVLLGGAALLVWGLGAMGPLTARELTEAEALERCESSIRGMLGAVNNPEFEGVTATRRATMWSVAGTVYTTGDFGGQWVQSFSCRVELNDQTWGVAPTLHGRALPVEE